MECVLVIAPHPDDGELSSGGTISRFIEEGKTIWYAAFSPCIESLPDQSDPKVLFNELKKALTILGVDTDKVITFDYPVRYFSDHRQSILERMVELRKNITPDLVLLPNSDDVHQDHWQIYQEGCRAFKDSCLLGYELPWNSLKFRSDFHVALSQRHLDKKLQCLEAYKSQQHRDYFDPSFIKSWARLRGIQIKKEYAEAFSMIRWIY